MTERRKIPKRPTLAAAPMRPQHSLFVLRETPCPYLPGLQERKLVTELIGPWANASYSELSRAGFRRSHLFAYKPACRHCAACVPVRVEARGYVPSKSQRRIARRNEDLSVVIRPAIATGEQFELFARYLATRHAGGDMADMTFADYRPMVEESAVDTRIAEFRDPSGTLVAGCLFDVLDDGTSAVYSFFAPEAAGRSLGTYVVHWLIQATHQLDLEFVYLGYWISASPKMAYKTRFRPLQALTKTGWQTLQD